MICFDSLSSDTEGIFNSTNMNTNMDTKIYRNKFVDFIQRMKYMIVIPTVENSKKLEYVDHVNKYVHINDYSFDKVFDAALRIALWLNYNCVYSFYTTVFKNYKNFVEEAKELVLEGHTRFDTKIYKDSAFNRYCHLYHSKSLKQDKKEAIIFIISKMFNEDDSHFNPEHEELIHPKESDIDVKLNHIISHVNNGMIGGSFAMAYYGDVYRNGFHDLDYIVHTCMLGDKLNDIIDRTDGQYITTNERKSIEEEIHFLFPISPIGKDIFEQCPNTVISRVGIKTNKEIRCIVNVIVNNRNYDIIFTNEYYKFQTEKIGDTYINVRDIQDSIRIKKTMNRDKDITDLILWSPNQFFCY